MNVTSILKRRGRERHSGQCWCPVILQLEASYLVTQMATSVERYGSPQVLGKD